MLEEMAGLFTDSLLFRQAQCLDKYAKLNFWS